MKKILPGFIAAVLCLSLAACGNSASSQQKVPEGTTSSGGEQSPNGAASSEKEQSPEDSVASGGERSPEGKAAPSPSGEPVTITVGVPASPPTLPILRMQETKALGDNVIIDLDIWSEPETLIAMAQDGKHDMFAFPLTIVATLYNKGVDVRLMNVNTWGVTYFMTSDPGFKSWADLKGKTLYIPLQSSPPDALSQYFLSQEGLRIPQDVSIVYGSLTEIATLLASGEAKYGVMIEPQVTKLMMANQNMRIAFSFQDEWQRVNHTDTMIPTAGFGVTQKFIDQQPQLTKQFQLAYAKAIDWVNENPAEAGKLAEEHLGLPAAVVEKAIPNMGLSFKNPGDAKPELDMLYDLLFHFNPKMIGGKIPDQGLYYDGK